MKHSIPITFILICMFIGAQILGLFVIQSYHPPLPEPIIINETVIQTHEIRELPMGIERPEIEENTAWLYIIIAILIGTGLLLALIKMNAVAVTKVWFFLAWFIALTIAFNAFLPQIIAIVLAIIIAGLRVIRNNTLVQNVSEMFIYGGIAALMYSIISIFAAIMLIIAIAIYDMIAVWKSKHMITLANYQTNQNMFAGIHIPYKTNKIPTQRKSHTYTEKNAKRTKSARKTTAAILGGGDIAFSLIFASAIMKSYTFLYALIPIGTATIALTLLFIFAQKGKMYPAMPFIGAGCLVGLGIVMLIA